MASIRSLNEEGLREILKPKPDGVDDVIGGCLYLLGAFATFTLIGGAGLWWLASYVPGVAVGYWECVGIALAARFFCRFLVRDLK